MRLYAAKVGAFATEVVKALIDSNDIEAENPREVELDVKSVMDSYIQTEREATEQARDILQMRGGTGDFRRIKKLAAEQKGIKIGDEAIDYLLDQIVEMLLHSHHVDEIYAEDVDLRRKMAPILKKYIAIDEEVEREVRGRLKHVQEGTRMWEVEYARMLEEIRRRKGL